MKKIILFTVIISFCLTNNIHFVFGSANGTYYDKTEKTICTYVETSDGNGWVVSDLSIQKDAKCLIVYDDKNTDDIYDDEIIRIFSF